MPTKWFTVIGLCEEARHAFHVRARSPKEAEKKCRRDHDAETRCTLTVAGVAEGKVRLVDEECPR